MNGVASTTALGRLFNKLTGDTITFNHFQQTTASGGASIAVGVQSTSKGDLATAFGTRTTATGGYSTALGVGASSIGQGSIALGGAANATGDTSIAIGTKVTTVGESASAMGYGSQANNKGSIAIGLNSKSGTVGSTEENTIAMGTNSQSLTANSVAIGTGSIGGSTGIGSSAVAIGNGASAKGSDGIALGSGSNANNMQNIAIGYKTETGKTQVAGSSNNTDIRNVSIGSEAGKGMGGKDNLFLGTSSVQTSNGDYNVAFGSGSGKSVTGSYNTAMGANAGIGVKNNNNVSIGADSGQNTDGLGNTAIGWQSGQAVKGNQNISMGYQSAKGLKGSSNTVIGNQAGIGGVEGDNNIILGTNATRLYTTGGSLKVQNVVSLGTNSKAYTDNSMSIGSYSEATGKAAIAIGQGSKASKDNSMAIGNGTLANTANGDVALGLGSATKAVTAVSNATITPPSSKSITYGTFAGNNPQSAVSVGTAGNERQIQNVAAGQISATSTDAINGSQLFAVANELGKTWKANAGGNLSGSATSTQVMPGDEVQFVAGKNLEVEQNLATGSQKYTYSLKKDVDLGSTGSLKAGPVTINNNGIDAGNKKITNVAPGTADTDAANVSQVKAATTTVSSNDASVTVNKVQKSDGHYNYDLSVDTNKIAANTNLTYKANSGTGLTTTLANGLDFKDGDNTVATVGPNGEVKYSLNPTVAGINSITTNGGNTVINDNGITTPKVTINNAPTAGTDATNKDYVDSTKTKVTSNDNSVVVNKTTNGNQDVYDLSVDVTKLDAANKSLSNINNAGNKVISDIARKSIDVVAGTNIKDIVKNDVQNSDGTTTTTYTINANGAKVLAGDGVTVATGTPGSDNITDYTVSVKNTTLTATPGSTTVTAGDNNSYAKAGDVATAITNVGKASKTTVTSNDSSVTVVSKVDSGDGHVNYDLSVDTSKVAANTNLTYKANSGTGLTTTLANGLDFKDGDNTVATVGPNGEVKYSLNPTVAGINSITTNGGNTVINDNGITTPKVTINNAPTAGTDATNKDYVDSTKTKVTSNDNSVVVNKTTNGNQDVYDLSVDVTKLDAANKSLSNINNAGNKVISNIARKSIDVVAGTNIKDIVKNDVQNSDGTTTTTYTINANGAKVLAGDGVTVATGTPGSNNITDYTVSVKNTTLTAAPGSTTVTAGDNNSYAKAGDVATAITKVGAASKTELQNGTNTNVTSHQGTAGQTIYQVNADKSEVAVTGTGLSLDSKTTTDSNGTKTTKYTLGLDTTQLTTTGGKVDAPTDPGKVVTAGDIATAINSAGWNVVAGNTGTGTTSGNVANKLITPGETVKLQAGDNLNVDQSGGIFTYSLKKDISLDSVTTGDTKVANGGITITNPSGNPVTLGPSGLNNGGNTITGVGNAVNDDDAVNLGQLKAVKNNPLKFGGDSGTVVTRKLGDQLDIKGGATGATTSGNIAVIADGNNTLNIQLAKNLTGLDSISTNGGNTVINDNGITTPKVTINNAPTAGTDATNKDYVDSTKTKVTSNDSSVVINKTTSGNQDVYDLSVDVTKLDAANKSLSNINNDGNKVISNIARKSIDVVAGTNIKDIVKNDVQNLDGTTTTTYTINANGAKVLAGDGVTVATGTPGSDNITDYTVSVKNTTLTAAPGSTTVTAGDNNSYAKAGDVATAITNVGKASKTTVTSNDSSVTVVSKVDSGDGHVNYDLSVDTSKVAANTNLTYKANSGTGLTTTLANGLDFKDGDNTKATVGPNGEVKYSLNPTVAGINSITTNGGNTVINDNGVTTPSLTLTNSTPLTSSTGGKVTVPAGTGNQAVTGQTVANAINKLGDNTINLKASDGNITTKQSLNKDGGLEFNITGSNGITTTASGDTINVTIAQSGLNTSTTGGKTTVTPVTGGNTYATAGDVATAIQNAVNNSGWNAVAGSTGTGTTSGSVSNKLITPGETVKLQAGDNLNVDQSGGTFTYSLKKDISLDSVTTGDTKVANGGITIGTGSNQVSLTNNGLNNGGNKITNVAAGTNKNDAVNVGQLNAAKTELENGTNTTVSSRTGSNGQTIYKVNTDFTSIADAIGGNTKFDPTTGKIDTSAANIGGTGQTNISDAVKAAITTVSSNDASVTVNKVQKSDGHYNYDLSVDTNKIAANTNLTYKANSGTGLTTTLANGLDFKDGDNTKATVGPNGEVKYSLNPTVAGINSITTNGGNTVINDNGVTTPSLTLTNSTPLTSSTGGKVTVPAGTGNQAVTGQTVANAINKLGDNTINLKASDGNITTKQSLNKDGGLEFNITGSNGITTTASGDTINVTIAQSGLNTSTTGGKTTVTPVTGGNTYATAGDVATAIQNAVNNSGWNAVAGSTGTGTTSGSVSNKLITPGETVKLQAGDNLNVDQSGGTFTYSLKNDINVNSITAGNNKFDTSGLTISDAAGNKAITTPSGTTYTNAAGNTTVINPTGVVINKSAADPSKSVSLTDNGLDNGGNKITNVAAGVNPTDAVNVSQLKNAVNNATYNGPVVYTNAAGEKIVKANNGNYYKALDVDSDGNPLPGKLPVSSSDIQHSLLNADGSTTNPSTLDNVGKGKISSSSKQAINGSQLNNLGTQ